ncbi:SWIB/MDM2 DOMAIN-CONTAINING PROTEIN-RELATED [Salix koriyanagi]|uniref:SWIB/MDM2 DOMAIN-CONTAINING PROTEIN-RELATED n=1 Tax=Salix koriyanagi TaxID=2511006 RepID=A0A9Q0X330_9ROSI|nr:SWIB/MDM2 DOMAIN-CONTAINING PROTEIN-RELATED [Salix koriyanagi]
MSMNNNSSSNNNNNPPKSLGQSSSPFGNSGMTNPSMGANPAFQQAQAQMNAGFQGGQFQLSQAQATMQAHLKAQQAHAQAQAAHAAQVQAAHAQFQAQLQAQGVSLNQNQSAGMGNLGSSSPSFSTPGNASAKRLPMKPLGRPPGVPMSSMVSPLKPMDLSSAARRKKQKLPEKQLQDRVAAILPESALYTQLLEFETRVDAALARKKVDIQEALKSPPCVQKTLRIYVFNTFANQIRTIPKKPNADPPTWTLKVIGRILEDGVDPDQPGAVQKSNPLYPKVLIVFQESDNSVGSETISR